MALAPEAAQLLAALDEPDAVPYAIAFYAGLRRSEIHRLEWPEVLEGDEIASRLRHAREERGRPRASPADRRSAPRHLAAAWERQGRPKRGPLRERSVMSGKLAARATAAWADAGIERITLHECRHTYASLLMAAGCTLKELMEFIGHADLQMVNRYVKRLPQPGEIDAAERLNDYLRRAESS